MAEGWRLYTGARVVDGHIASLLKHISEAHFQRSIRDINFNCHLAVHRLGHHFNLQLTLTEIIRDALGWYPGLLLWHNNDYPCRAIEGCYTSLNPFDYVIVAPRRHVPTNPIDGHLVHETLLGIVLPHYFPLYLRVLIPSPRQPRYLPLPVPVPVELPVDPATSDCSPIISIPTPSSSIPEDEPVETESLVSRKEKKAQRGKEFRKSEWFREKRKVNKKASKARKARERAEQRAAESSSAGPSSTNAAAADDEEDSSSWFMEPAEFQENNERSGPSRSNY
ncbi:hypothetical protein FRC03_004013 [Tulasnella sp. 419]|nr:hypothetical protein FRC03_004013 [Tulasnella sp. 419]